MTGTILTIGAVCAIAYAVYKRKQNKYITLNDNNTETSIVDGELCFTDVIAYFKGLNLKKGEDIPFICRESQRTKEIFNIYRPEFKQAGYTWLFIGVYNENSEEITNYKVIYAKSLDKAITDTFNGEDLVILN